MPSNIKRFYLSGFLPVLAFSLCSFSGPAHAGFEWTAPEAQQTPSSALPETATPMPEVTPAPVLREGVPLVVEMTPPQPEPIVEEPALVPEESQPQAENEPLEISPSSEEPRKETLEINPFPVGQEEAVQSSVQDKPVLLPMDSKQPLADMSSEAVEMPQESAVQGEDTASKDFEIVQGFGSDMPLALALRQVVPPQYAFSFDKDVNPGIRVSWNGGKPWDQVARDMLSPVGMDISIQSKTVTVRSLAGQVERLEAQPAALEAPGDIQMIEEPQPQEQMEAPLPLLEETQDTAKEAQKRVEVPETEMARNNIIDPGVQEATQPVMQEDEITPMPIFTEEAPAPESAAASHEFAHLVSEPEPEQVIEDIVEETAPVVPMPEKLMAPDVDAMRVWEAKKGASLKELLYEWSTQSGVSLAWEDGRDYKLSSNIYISGTYENALKVLFSKAVQDGPKYSFTKEGRPELVVGR